MAFVGRLAYGPSWPQRITRLVMKQVLGFLALEKRSQTREGCDDDARYQLPESGEEGGDSAPETFFGGNGGSAAQNQRGEPELRDAVALLELGIFFSRHICEFLEGSLELGHVLRQRLRIRHQYGV